MWLAAGWHAAGRDNDVPVTILVVLRVRLGCIRLFAYVHGGGRDRMFMFSFSFIFSVADRERCTVVLCGFVLVPGWTVLTKRGRVAFGRRLELLPSEGIYP